MPAFPVNTASSTIHGPGFLRNRNCPARPASLIGSTCGTQTSTSITVMAAHAARMPKARRQDMNSAINVPAGTPSMFATVWPVTIIETACASLPLSAKVLAMSVAVPKKAPWGRPAMKRAAMSIGEFNDTALSRLPASAIAMNRTMSLFGGTRRPKTSISVPMHTPIA